MPEKLLPWGESLGRLPEPAISVGKGERRGPLQWSSTHLFEPRPTGLAIATMCRAPPQWGGRHSTACAAATSGMVFI